MHINGYTRNGSIGHTVHTVSNYYDVIETIMARWTWKAINTRPTDQKQIPTYTYTHPHASHILQTLKNHNSSFMGSLRAFVILI